MGGTEAAAESGEALTAAEKQNAWQIAMLASLCSVVCLSLGDKSQGIGTRQTRNLLPLRHPNSHLFLSLKYAHIIIIIIFYIFFYPR